MEDISNSVFGGEFPYTSVRGNLGLVIVMHVILKIHLSRFTRLQLKSRGPSPGIHVPPFRQGFGEHASTVGRVEQQITRSSETATGLSPPNAEKTNPQYIVQELWSTQLFACCNLWPDTCVACTKLNFEPHPLGQHALMRPFT